MRAALEYLLAYERRIFKKPRSLWSILRLDSVRNWRERRKMRWQQEEAEKLVVSTALKSTFTDLVSQDRLSRTVADEYLRKISRIGLPNLLPPPDADVVKAQINGRGIVQKGDKNRKTKLTLVEVERKPKLTLAG